MAKQIRTRKPRHVPPTVNGGPEDVTLADFLPAVPAEDWRIAVWALIRRLDLTECQPHADDLRLVMHSLPSGASPDAELIMLTTVRDHLAALVNDPPQNLTPERRKQVNEYVGRARVAVSQRHPRITDEVMALARASLRVGVHLDASRNLESRAESLLAELKSQKGGTRITDGWRVKIKELWKKARAIPVPENRPLPKMPEPLVTREDALVAVNLILAWLNGGAGPPLATPVTRRTRSPSPYHPGSTRTSTG
jgi:hypothetical protein